MTVLVTGAAGFIGFHISRRLLNDGIPVIGYDNINDYYDVNLKKARLNELKKISKINNTKFSLIKNDLENNEALNMAFQGKLLNGDNLNIGIPKKVIHLAAQAGVRYSIENPNAYIQSNIVGFGNILENSRKHRIEHLVYASSSSVYGGNTNVPFSEKHCVDHPVSLYAATKKSNELMAHSYSHLYKIPMTGLRFFTVYGPFGRPDMALFIFTKAILENKPINLFNNGNMIRDFTYIDDIVESVIRVLKKPPKSTIGFDTKNPDPSKSWAPYNVFNIGNSSPTPLLEYVQAIEKSLNKISQRKLLPMQPGDVEQTASDCKSLEKWINFQPKTSIQDGVDNFTKWYVDFYNCSQINIS